MVVPVAELVVHVTVMVVHVTEMVVHVTEMVVHVPVIDWQCGFSVLLVLVFGLQVLNRKLLSEQEHT